MHPDTAPDVEAILRHEPASHAAELRLWLRLLSCTNLFSTVIRRRLREDFGVTLPQFDLMAQLHREPEGLRLGELSARMMVTNGNITGLVSRLEGEGLVRRRQVPEDRRAAVVVLTAAGERAFARMASAHSDWIADLLANVGRRRITAVTRDLRLVKDSVLRATLPRGAR
jgi:DNA-binding MarR family transcriptional regulator